jgi:hypothetical protein
MVMVGDRERYCGDVLRNARAAVLRDAEALPGMLFAQERVGAIMTGKSGTLLGYQKTLTEVGSRSPLAETVPRRHSALHVDFTMRIPGQAVHDSGVNPITVSILKPIRLRRLGTA